MPPESAAAHIPGTAKVSLDYLGHAAFLWTAPDRSRLVVDPYQDPAEGPRWFEREFPAVDADIVVSTHDHFDHNATDRVCGSPIVLTGQGEHVTPGIRVTATPDVHAGRWVMPNSLVVVEAAGVRFVHCGDNRADVAGSAASAVGRADVVMVPVDDSRHLLTWDETWRLAATFSPRVIVPMHYLAPGIVTPSSTLLGIEGWLASLHGNLTVRRFTSAGLSLGREDLPPPGATEVWVLGPSRAGGGD